MTLAQPSVFESRSSKTSCNMEWNFDKGTIGNFRSIPTHQSTRFSVAALDGYEFYFIIDGSAENITVAICRSDMQDCPLDIAGTSITFCGVTHVYPPNSMVDQYGILLEDFISVEDVC
jgi:hypothetical protein